MGEVKVTNNRGEDWGRGSTWAIKKKVKRLPKEKKVKREQKGKSTDTERYEPTTGYNAVGTRYLKPGERKSRRCKKRVKGGGNANPAYFEKSFKTSRGHGERGTAQKTDWRTGERAGVVGRATVYRKKNQKERPSSRGCKTGGGGKRNSFGGGGERIEQPRGLQ